MEARPLTDVSSSIFDYWISNRVGHSNFSPIFQLDEMKTTEPNQRLQTMPRRFPSAFKVSGSACLTRSVGQYEIQNRNRNENFGIRISQVSESPLFRALAKECTSGGRSRKKEDPRIFKSRTEVTGRSHHQWNRTTRMNLTGNKPKPTAPNQRLQTMRFELPMNARAQGPHV